MAAQVDLNRWREPTELEIISLGPNESCLGQVHFGGDGLHPFGVALAIQQAHSSRIARKRLVGESVNLNQSNGHEFRRRGT